LIDGEEYLQEVSRYIHLNPVRVKGGKRLEIGEKKRILGFTGGSFFITGPKRYWEFLSCKVARKEVRSKISVNLVFMEGGGIAEKLKLLPISGVGFLQTRKQNLHGNFVLEKT
jgi:murein DD-endopeptidase MepM/ murein hydrolase activator NlpD